MKVQYFNFQNEGQEEKVRELLAPLLCIIPGWVHRLDVCGRVSTGDRNTDPFAACQCRFPYHEADILLYDRFWSLPEFDQRETLIHEIAHFFSLPFQCAVMEDALGKMEEENPEAYGAYQALANFISETLATDLAPLLEQLCEKPQ